MSKIKINVQSQSTRQTITKTKKSPRPKTATIWTWTRVRGSSKKSWSPGWRSSKNSWNLAMANFIAFSKRSKHKVRLICLRKEVKLRKWKAKSLIRQYELRSLNWARTGSKLISDWHHHRSLNSQWARLQWSKRSKKLWNGALMPSRKATNKLMTSFKKSRTIKSTPLKFYQLSQRVSSVRSEARSSKLSQRYFSKSKTKCYLTTRSRS